MSSEKIEAFYEKERPFKDEINRLRSIVLATELEESLKWGAPVYTLHGKNVLGIMSFKNHFGIWFFNGSFLSDPKGILETAQEKTKGMRHIRFQSAEEIDRNTIIAYIAEAIENQRNGRVLVPERKKKLELPKLLRDALKKNPALKTAYGKFTPYKQREFCEYLESAKQEKTKITRLNKILTLIESGTGLNDKYRK